ncbi:MAG: hypothetical protein HRU32_16555 [Rhodobacteraceae bacterium]|nr:hypothetical protein [Paracoccaceae bacterium]
MPRHTPEQIAEIRGHLASLERGKQTVAELASKIGVAAWTVYSWKRRFGAASSKPRRRRRSEMHHADLIEVGRLPASDPIEIIVGAMTVRVPPTFDADELRRLLEVVRAC